MKNWKTTVMGIFTGLVSALILGFQNGAFELNWKSVLAFVVSSAWGLIQKDFDKSNASNPVETQKV